MSSSEVGLSRAAQDIVYGPKRTEEWRWQSGHLKLLWEKNYEWCCCLFVSGRELLLYSLVHPQDSSSPGLGVLSLEGGECEETEKYTICELVSQSTSRGIERKSKCRWVSLGLPTTVDFIPFYYYHLVDMWKVTLLPNDTLNGWRNDISINQSGERRETNPLLLLC